MSATQPVGPERRSLPLILIRGFGGSDVSDEKKIAFRGLTTVASILKSAVRATSTKA